MKESLLKIKNVIYLNYQTMPKISEVKYDGPKKTIQSKFSEDAIKDKLKGYTLVQPAKLKDIEAGDDIRYMTNSSFKSGGRVKANKFPEYLVCMNVFKNISWCIQYRDPTLKVWVKSKEKRQKEKDQKEKIIKMYEEGKLVPKKKSK
jgi:hypothetical protein